MSELTPDGFTPDFPVPAQPVARRRPPALVWVACGFLIFFGAISALGAVAAFALVQSGVAVATWLGAMMFSFAVVYLVVAVFLFRGKSWARWTGIAVAGINVGASLLTALTDGLPPNCIGLLLQALIVVLLLRKEVAEWCYPQ